MSTPAQIHQVYKAEVRFPADLVHNGHSYIFASRFESRPLRKAINRVRGMVLRVHRISGNAISMGKQ